MLGSIGTITIYTVTIAAGETEEQLFASKTGGMGLLFGGCTACLHTTLFEDDILGCKQKWVKICGENIFL